ncbi:unnamed protein product [Dicrocoelium dendriticum]|nr:unnamed protein product [Dicrocoelium dendriticum]
MTHVLQFAANCFSVRISPTSCLYSSTIHVFRSLVEQWPPDSCGRKFTLKELLQKRATAAIFDPDTTIISDQECQSLQRLLSNYHRDKYKLPKGLGQGTTNTGAPRIAASGADLLECRRFLSKQDEYAQKQAPMWKRCYSSVMRIFYGKSNG